MRLDIQTFKAVPVCKEFVRNHEFREPELEHLMKLDMIDGYHLQFGVHKGYTLNFMAKLKPDVLWYGFDSMEGLPHNWRLSKRKEISKYKFRLSNPPELEPNVSYIKGWFADTIKPFVEDMSGPVAFMDIDCDVYSSARDVLFGMNERIVPGTVIRFDELCDWREFGWVKDFRNKSAYETWREHEWKALNEWLEECDREVEAIYRTDWLAGTVRVTK